MAAKEKNNFYLHMVYGIWYVGYLIYGIVYEILPFFASNVNFYIVYYKNKNITGACTGT